MDKTTTVMIFKYPQHSMGDQSGLCLRHAGSDILKDVPPELFGA